MPVAGSAVAGHRLQGALAKANGSERLGQRHGGATGDRPLDPRELPARFRQVDRGGLQYGYALAGPSFAQQELGIAQSRAGFAGRQRLAILLLASLFRPRASSVCASPASARPRFEGSAKAAWYACNAGSKRLRT